MGRPVLLVQTARCALLKHALVPVHTLDKQHHPEALVLSRLNRCCGRSGSRWGVYMCMLYVCEHLLTS